jgi:hypothetical protein
MNFNVNKGYIPKHQLIFEMVKYCFLWGTDWVLQKSLKKMVAVCFKETTQLMPGGSKEE